MQIEINPVGTKLLPTGKFGIPQGGRKARIVNRKFNGQWIRSENVVINVVSKVKQ
jgi:hypothetical protein